METKIIIANIAADINVANLRICNKDVMNSAYEAKAEFSYIGFGSLVNGWMSEFDAHLVGFDLLEATPDERKLFIHLYTLKERRDELLFLAGVAVSLYNQGHYSDAETMVSLIADLAIENEDENETDLILEMLDCISDLCK